MAHAGCYHHPRTMSAVVAVLASVTKDGPSDVPKDKPILFVGCPCEECMKLLDDPDIPEWDTKQ